MERVVRAFPILRGREKAVEDLARAMTTTRAAEAAEFYQRHGVAHESWYAQQTPQGMLVIAITDFAERPAEMVADDYAKSTAPFESWFKAQVMNVSGIDPSVAPLGPPTLGIFQFPKPT
jgi:hypothetical protein